MAKDPHRELSRRERQIMDVLYRLETATVAQVREALPDPPSYSSVRTLLRILEEKGHIDHRADGPRYLYFPKVAAKRAQRAAVEHVVRTFFSGSAERAFAALLDLSRRELTDEQLDQLQQLVDDARQEGR